VRLQELVDLSNAVAEVSGRLEKTGRLAACLERLPADEIEIAVAFLSGAPRQGRIGLGWSAISDAARVSPASSSAPSIPPSIPPLTDNAGLELHEVDAAFDQIAHTTGPGAARARVSQLSTLFGRATRTERDFLVRLLSGELRQGALEGILIEAVARAARISPATVRQATMTAGDFRFVARVALTDGAAGLSQVAVQLFRPVQPMLAESAASIAEALEDLGQAMFEIFAT